MRKGCLFHIKYYFWIVLFILLCEATSENVTYFLMILKLKVSASMAVSDFCH